MFVQGVNRIASIDVIMTEGVEFIVAKANCKLALFDRVVWKRWDASVIKTPQHKLAATQQSVRILKFGNFGIGHVPVPVKSIDGPLEILFPNIFPHLRGLSEKFRLYDSAASGL